MTNKELINILNNNYDLLFNKIRLYRKGGNYSYLATTDTNKYFVKTINKPFIDSFIESVKINLFLDKHSLQVPKIIMSTKNEPYIIYQNKRTIQYIIVYNYLELSDIDLNTDLIRVGEIIAQMHLIMKNYNGNMIVRDKKFYIERYIDILKKKKYSKIKRFKEIGDMLWEKVKDLPMSYMHGDLYLGNIQKDQNNNIYIIDFDTSCIGFPMYDLALICNQTDYFNYDDEGYNKTTLAYQEILKGYLKYINLTQEEISSVYFFIGIYHFALQATILEIYGLDAVNNDFFDYQLSWLEKWINQIQ